MSSPLAKTNPAPPFPRDAQQNMLAGEALHLAVPAELLEAVAGRVAELLAPLLAVPAVSPWLTVPEAAEHLRCKPKRVYDLISQRRVPAHHDGGRVLLRRDELDAYVLDGADTLLTPAANDLQTGRFSGAQRTVSPRIKERRPAA